MRWHNAKPKELYSPILLKIFPTLDNELDIRFEDKNVLPLTNSIGDEIYIPRIF